MKILYLILLVSVTPNIARVNAYQRHSAAPGLLGPSRLSGVMQNPLPGPFTAMVSQPQSRSRHVSRHGPSHHSNARRSNPITISPLHFSFTVVIHPEPVLI